MSFQNPYGHEHGRGPTDPNHEVHHHFEREMKYRDELGEKKVTPNSTERQQNLWAWGIQTNLVKQCSKEIEEYVQCTRQEWKNSIENSRRNDGSISDDMKKKMIPELGFDILRKDGVIEKSGIENWLFDVLNVVPQDRLIARSFNGYPQFRNQRPMRRLELMTGKGREGRNCEDGVRSRQKSAREGRNSIVRKG
jgi:hypothetical protein